MKISLFIICTIMFSTVSSLTPDQNGYALLKDNVYKELLKLINGELGNLPTTYHPRIKEFVKKMVSQGRLKLDKFELASTEDVLVNKHNLPKEVVDKFKGIIWASQVTFKSFSVVVNYSDSQLDMVVGAAGKSSGMVEMSYMRLSVTAELIPALNWVNERSCKKRFFRKKCSDNWRAYPRGYTPEELQIIKDSLRAEAFRAMSESVRKLVYNFDEIWFNELIKQTMQEAMKNLEEKARIEFSNAMNYVKEAKLQPLMQTIDAMIERNNQQITLLIEKTIESFKKAIEEVVQILKDKFLEIKDSVMYSVEFLYTYASSKVDALKAQLQKDYETIVDRVNSMVYKLNCAFSGIEGSLKSGYVTDLTNSKDFFDNREKCIDEVNNTYFVGRMETIPEDMNINELYEVKKCVLIKNINENKMEGDDAYFYNLRTYKQLIDLASEMRCMSTAKDSKSNIKHYLKEMIKFTNSYSDYNKKNTPAIPEI